MPHFSVRSKQAEIELDPLWTEPPCICSTLLLVSTLTWHLPRDQRSPLRDLFLHALSRWWVWLKTNQWSCNVWLGLKLTPSCIWVDGVQQVENIKLNILSPVCRRITGFFGWKCCKRSNQNRQTEPLWSNNAISTYWCIPSGGKLRQGTAVGKKVDHFKPFFKHGNFPFAKFHPYFFCPMHILTRHTSATGPHWSHFLCI